MTKGWYPKHFDYCDNLQLYLTSRPLNDKQQVIMMASNCGHGYYEIAFGVFSNDISFFEMFDSPAWFNITSTNEKPSFRTAILGVECLRECEEEIKRLSNGKRRIVYISAMDRRRMRAYQAIIKRYNLGYKQSTVREENFDNSVFKMYKVL